MADHKKITAIGAAILFAITTSAGAGDYYPPEELDGTPGGTMVEFGTGWYLRGDIGGSINVIDPSFVLNNVATGLDLGRTGSIGVGAGYIINDWFRVDATIEQFTNMEFDDRRVIGCGTFNDDGDILTPEVPVTGTCDETRTLEAGATALMINAYMDLGKFNKFTPYVGAGAGMAYVRWGSYTEVAQCVAGGGADCGNGTITEISNNVYSSNKEWKPAAAVMAGFSYDITQNLKLDAGYKFTYIGGGDATENVAVGGGLSSLSYDSFNIHQVRIGLRYEIW